MCESGQIIFFRQTNPYVFISKNCFRMESGKKINKKRLENLERIKKKKEAKLSKSKAKKLAQLTERKHIKQTRESLFVSLRDYQLNDECIKKLQSSSGPPPLSLEDNSNGLVKKLRCVSSIKIVSKRQQRDHIDTDSSSCEQEANDNDVSIVQTIVNTNSSPSDDESPSPLLPHHPQIKEDDLLTTGSSNIHVTSKDISISKLHSKGLSIVDDGGLSRIKGEHVAILREPRLERERQKLPINAEEQPIVEAINDNLVVIICGETGSGKTTQVPQFLYEAGYTSNGHLIGVTEPRRIAAISMASRVGQELGNSKIASYQIRYEGDRTNDTRILFMTDGVLLKELQTDCTLSRYSVIIIDEAHDRSIHSDVLIGLLSRICTTRKKRHYPLKLVIMSATLRLQDFLREKLFPNIQPNVIKVESRQFPVTVYFERRTPENCVEAAYKKVCRIHEGYPPGGILVFLSGQHEVKQLIDLLNRRYARLKNERKTNRVKRKRNHSVKQIDEDMVVDYEEFGVYDADEPTNFEVEEDEFVVQELRSEDSNCPALHCLPLYSLLPIHLQKRVFDSSECATQRTCIVSTNVAETSLTIPNIRYVVDSGKEKRREYDPITQVSRFVVDWCSKASADQRSGRAGRVQSGYTFRLYSSAVYEDMSDYARPEILNKPAEQLVLLLKSMNFAKVTNFPFPTPPKPDQIKFAELRLSHLGALKQEGTISRITPLGKTLVQIPLAPGFAKIVVKSFGAGLLPYAVTLVSALSVREPLIQISAINEDSSAEKQVKMAEILSKRRLWCTFGEARLMGDLTVLLNVIGAADHEDSREDVTELLGLRPKALKEINKLRAQLVCILNASKALNENLPKNFKIQPPSQEQLRTIRKLMTKCFPDKIAKRIDSAGAPNGSYQTQLMDEFVFIDPCSMLYKIRPDFVLYQEILQLSEKKCMQYIATVEPEWIPSYVTFPDVTTL